MSKKSRFTKDMNDFQRFMFGRNEWNVQLGGWIKYLTYCSDFVLVLDVPWGDRLIISPQADKDVFAKDFSNSCHVNICRGDNHYKDDECIRCTFNQLRHILSIVSKREKRKINN